MSDVAKQMIICPHCHRTAYFNIWNSINTKTDPETYGQVRRLSLFRFCCPYCRQTSTINYSFLYHQMESALMIYYIPEDEEADTTQNLLDAVSAGTPKDEKPDSDSGMKEEERALENALAHYKYRIVRTHEEFLEKLAIFDAGLDDRIVELAKVIVGAEAERQLSETGFRVKSAFFSFSKEKNEKKLVFRDKNSSQTANYYNYISDVDYQKRPFKPVRRFLSALIPRWRIPLSSCHTGRRFEYKNPSVASSPRGSDCATRV